MDAAVYKKLDDIYEEIKVLTRGEYADVFQITQAIRRGATIQNGTEFVLPHSVYGDILCVTRGRNIHHLAADPSAPTVTFQPKYLLSSNGGSSAATFQFDRPEAMFAALETAVTDDPDKAKKSASLLYSQALLIAGLPLDDPSEYTDLVCELMK